jgi:AcrR family transcriptional regulator
LAKESGQGWDDAAVTATNRTSYHHGDLRNALTDAATELAIAGGPEAVVLREAARHVGVSATAAYRHFAGHAELIHAVKERALARLAASMQAELDKLTPTGDPAADAAQQLLALGRGYLRFADTQSGLFRIAFDDRDREVQVEKHGPSQDSAYLLLSGAVDDLVSAGVLPESRRPHTETVIWSVVHGLAMLLQDGPLREMPESERVAAFARVGEIILHGI